MNIYNPYNQSDFDRALESVVRRYGEITNVEKRFCTDTDMVYTGGATSKIFYVVSSLLAFNPSGGSLTCSPTFMNGAVISTSVAAAAQTSIPNVTGQLIKGLNSNAIKIQAFCWIFNLQTPIP